MATRYNTACFVSKEAAIKYFDSQECDSEEVERKIAAGEIFIGKPNCSPGDRIGLDLSEGRYFLEAVEVIA